MSLDRPVKPDPYDLLPKVPSFTVTSDDVTDGQPLKDDQVAEFGNSSPQLSWSGAPEGTKSYTVTCYDPDAPTPNGFWHWVARRPAAPTSPRWTPAPAPRARASPATRSCSTTTAASSGSWVRRRPPGDQVHRYYFVVHAVTEESLGVDARVSFAVLSFNLAFKTAGRAIVTGHLPALTPRGRPVSLAATRS